MAQELTSTRVTRDPGIAPAATTSDGTGQLLIGNDGNVILLLEGAAGKACHITPSATVAGQTLAATTVVIPAEGFLYCGPFPPVLFNDEQDRVSLNADTGVQITVLGI